MNNLEKRSGGCHCGAVRFDVELDLGEPVNARCLDGVDVTQLKVHRHDGKNA
jgi:hypothetical protein